MCSYMFDTNCCMACDCQPHLLTTLPVTTDGFKDHTWPQSLPTCQVKGFCLNVSVCCIGWRAILLTWAWALVIWQVADFVKFLVTWVLQDAEDIQTECIRDEKPLPFWVKLVNAPGVAGDRFMSVVSKPFEVSLLHTRQSHLTVTWSTAVQ